MGFVTTYAFEFNWRQIKRTKVRYRFGYPMACKLVTEYINVSNFKTCALKIFDIRNCDDRSPISDRQGSCLFM